MAVREIWRLHSAAAGLPVRVARRKPIFRDVTQLWHPHAVHIADRLISEASEPETPWSDPCPGFYCLSGASSAAITSFSSSGELRFRGRSRVIARKGVRGAEKTPLPDHGRVSVTPEFYRAARISKRFQNTDGGDFDRITQLIAIFERMIREKYFAPTREDRSQMLAASKSLKSPHLGSVRDNVASLRRQPHPGPLRVVDENVWRAWRIGTVHEIVEPSVQQQSRAVGVEKNRRERVVVMIDDQLARR